MRPASLHLRSFSLRTQIGWAVGVVLSLTLVIQAMLLFSAARTELKHSQAAQLDVLVNRVGAELDDKVGLRISILEAMGKKFPVAALEDVKVAERYFSNSPNLGTLFDDFYLFSPQGVLTVDWPLAPGRRGLDMVERDYIQGVIRSRKASISKPILGRATRQPIVVIAVPVCDDQGNLVGILGGVVNLQKSRLLEPLTSTRVGNTGYFYLVGPERLTMMHPDSRRVLQRLSEPGAIPALDRALDGVSNGSLKRNTADNAPAKVPGPDDSTVEGVDEAGIPGLFSFERMQQTGWVLAGFLPADEALAAVNKLSTRVLASTVLFVLLALALLGYLLRRVTQPLELLTDFLNTSRSLAPPPAVLHNCRETDRLADAFGQFLTQQHNTQDQLAAAHQHAQASNADLRVAAIAFESQIGMFITDADNRIVRVNHAFSHISGYSRAESLGQTPALLSSGRHDAAFYAGLHTTIQRQRSWRGEVMARRKNSDIYPAALTLTVVTDEAGIFTHQVGTLTDISQRKAAEEEIQRLAFYDPLTQLPNRRLLLDRLEHALAASARSGRMGALFFMDLDNFKVLNDSLGHDMGDLLLQQVARRLQNSVREGDTVARLGGDEFVLVLEDLSQHITDAATQAETLGDKVLAALNQAYDLAGQSYHCSASMGVALWVGRRHSVDELMKFADLAMYEAKRAGRRTLRFFDPAMQAAIRARAALERDLREGLAQDQFLLYYQAQVNAQGHITGAEALLRWQHPLRGLELPSNFIPLAEETGLILSIGPWVLEAACQQLANWAHTPTFTNLTIAVNVSAAQLKQADFAPQVLATLARTGANPQRLKLELTESLLLTDVEVTKGKMEALQAHGISFSLDDFGTGYSSLSYLKRLPFDQLKIDQSFVRDLLTDPNDEVIAGTIVLLAHSLGLSVMAEGVETGEQRDCLIAQGCVMFQGYWFSAPLPIAEFERLEFAAQKA